MNNQVSQVLRSVAVDTIEKLAFMFAYGEEDAENTITESDVCAAVAFNGPFSGTLTLQIGSADLVEMAANMLGMENGDDLTPEYLQDALKEALNVICGNILPAIAGVEAVFDIAAPNIIESESPTPGAFSAQPFAETVFNLEEGGCRLALFLDEPISAAALKPAAAL